MFIEEGVNPMNIVLIIVFLACLLTGLYFLQTATRPKVKTYESTFQFEVKENNVDIEAFSKLDKIEMFFKGHKNHSIHGFLIPRNREKLVVISHGYTLSLAGSIKYADMFLKNDYSVFLYDHRNHGLSGGDFTSFGYYEKEDLNIIIKNLKQRGSKSMKIGLLGESLGAATVLQFVAENDNVDFAIADCPYSDLKELFLYRMKYDYGFGSKFIINIASVLSLFIQGWSFKHASLKGKLAKVQTPILFIHGEKDMYIPKRMSEEMYMEKNINKWLYIVPGARHAQSLKENPEMYETQVNRFLKEILF